MSLDQTTKMRRLRDYYRMVLQDENQTVNVKGRTKREAYLYGTMQGIQECLQILGIDLFLEEHVKVQGR